MNRITTLFFLITGVFILVWIRLFYWQIIQHKPLQAVADAQHYYRLEIPPTRGEILSSDGSPFVTNQTAYLVFAEKRNIQDHDRFVKTAARILGEAEASVAAQLTIHPVWVPLKTEVDEETVRKLKDAALPGLGFERADIRYYPESSMAAHILGFVGKNNDGQDQGYFGLEGYYDKELRGQSGYLRQERDANGNPIVIGETSRIEPKNGRTLELYVNKSIQFIVEEKLKAAMESYGAKAGAVIVMDPFTGGIIASASYPSYDPSHYGDFPSEYYKNPVVSDSYEPGSTFKPLLIAKGIESKTVTPTDIFDETGPVRVGQYSIKTWDNKYHGMISISQILQYSSNVGMVYIADKIGNDPLLSFLKQVGLNEKTDIDVEEEDVPTLRSDQDWHDIDYKTASFGQGIAATPLQVLRAEAAIANGGNLMEPHIVKAIVSNFGDRIEIQPKKIRQIFSYQTAKITKEMMVDAVEHGEVHWKIPQGYRIAGKTGTAQIPVAGHYDTEKTIASFVGFAPSDNPKFIMLVTLREPESSPWGSETAAPLFFDIARELLVYYNISRQ